ncbi:S-formylglutathione hydrolase [Undibacterium sp. MH2W]|uniref:S-formylglutathione hydrolase n=1 Tax=Undibacterium sp. MH2W TaxID=3413044 RepID=UPI003BF0E7F3
MTSVSLPALPAGVELLSQHASFGGRQQFYLHASTEIGLPMRFSVYLPPQALAGEVCPAIFFLAGLTCSEETFMIKAGAQRVAAREGLILITPDTSPRGADLPGESDAWDLGVAAGFYLNATAAPWHQYYRMESYIVEELRPLLLQLLPVDAKRLGIMGHSMGGHGALTLALRHPGVFQSVSALAPIAAPLRCPWGQKAFRAYLGDDEASWAHYDASALMAHQQQVPYPGGILIDQGEADQFLVEQLHPHIFQDACEQVGQPLTLRYQPGYDHGYYFVSSFIEDHLLHHHAQLSV